MVKSKEAVINVNTGAVPAVIINTPTVVAETDFDNKIVKARITNTFNVKYLEDDRHMTTTWILKYGDSIVWQSNGDPVHLLSYDIPLTEILYDKDYTLEVYWTASNNQDSARGYAREFMLSKEEAYLKKVYDGTADASRLKVEVTSEGRVPFYEYSYNSRYRQDQLTPHYSFYGAGAYERSYWRGATSGTSIVYKTRITLDNVPITDWETTMSISFNDVGKKYSHHHNHNS